MKQQIKEFDLEGLFNFNIYDEFGKKESLVWKRREMALFLLGSFSNDIIVSQIRRNGEKSIDNLINALINSIKKEENPMSKKNILKTFSSHRKMSLDNRKSEFMPR